MSYPERFIAVLILLLTAGSVFAQDYRKDTLEMALRTAWSDDVQLDGSNGSGVAVDSDLGFGFSAGINYSSRLNLRVDFDRIDPSYDLRLVPENPTDDVVRVRNRLTSYTLQVNGTYHFLDGPITPWIEGGLGWNYVDSNVASGPPVTGCYWHPFFGFICSGYYRTYGDDGLTYNLGLGLRVDLRDNWFLRGGINRQWTNAGSTRDDLEFDTIRVDVGFRF